MICATSFRKISFNMGETKRSMSMSRRMTYTSSDGMCCSIMRRVMMVMMIMTRANRLWRLEVRGAEYFRVFVWNTQGQLYIQEANLMLGLRSVSTIQPILLAVQLILLELTRRLPCLRIVRQVLRLVQTTACR